MQYYYVFGGGVDIQLRRSLNLSANSWSEPAMMATGCAKRPPGNSKYNRSDPDCAPGTNGTNMTRPAPGYFADFWASPAGQDALPFLQNLTAWDYGTTDADFCDEAGKGPTRFIYEQNTQGTAHREPPWSGRGGGFYQVDVFDGNEFEFLASFFA